MRYYLIFILASTSIYFNLNGQNDMSKWKHFVEGRHYINPKINEGDNFLTGIGLTSKLIINLNDKNLKSGSSLNFSVQYFSNYDLNELKVEGYSIGSLFNQDFKLLKSSNKWNCFLSGGGEIYFMNRQEQWKHHFAAIAQLGLSYKNRSALIKEIDVGLSSSLFIGSVADLSFPNLSGIFLRFQFWQQNLK